MFAKKAADSSNLNRGHRKELDDLYARKSTIDSLIRSLEDYDRYRSKPPAVPKLKTA